MRHNPLSRWVTMAYGIGFTGHLLIYVPKAAAAVCNALYKNGSNSAVFNALYKRGTSES